MNALNKISILAEQECTNLTLEQREVSAFILKMINEDAELQMALKLYEAVLLLDNYEGESWAQPIVFRGPCEELDDQPGSLVDLLIRAGEIVRKAINS